MINNPDPRTWFSIYHRETFRNYYYDIEVDSFPDGSFSFRCKIVNTLPEVTIQMASTLPQAIVGLWQLVDTLLRQNKDIQIYLRIQTAPDQRADRVTKAGECIAAKVSANMIANCGISELDKIYLYDVHSRVFVEELKRQHPNVVECSNLDCFKKTGAPTPNSKDWVVAVDHGSIGRAREFAKEYDLNIIYCDKDRVRGYVLDMEIIRVNENENYDLPASLDNKSVWVVDDLCDGGKTFEVVADLIRGKFSDIRKMHLYVTHGLFTKGKEELYKRYDTVNALWDYSL